jgi:hypothetical protein
VPDVEERLADNCDDRRLKHLQFPAGSDAKRKLDLCPTEYDFAELTPLRFCWYLNHNSAGFVASHILKGDMKVAVLFCAQINYATHKSMPFLFPPDAF